MAIQALEIKLIFDWYNLHSGDDPQRGCLNDRLFDCGAAVVAATVASCIRYWQLVAAIVAATIVATIASGKHYIKV